MREILFRGKAVIDVECPDYCGESDVKNGDWVFGDLIWNNGVPFIVKNVIESNWEYISIEAWTPVDPSTVGQFTGLTDKNGKKIFEGDIVRFIWWWFDGAERESELTGTIVYSSDNMSFQLKGVKNKEWRDIVGADEHDMDYLTPFSELNFCDADFKIIGNIHDQKEDV